MENVQKDDDFASKGHLNQYFNWTMSSAWYPDSYASSIKV